MGIGVSGPNSLGQIFPVDVNSRISNALGTIASILGVRATYTRGQQSCSLVAVPINAVSRGVTDDGVIVESRTQDYSLCAADLRFGATYIEPKRGDKIAVIRNGKVSTYEVGKSGTAEKPWRYVDPGQTRYRIHTILKNPGVA